MDKTIILVVFLSALLMGCTGLHDSKGWEHTGDPETHQDSKPYILKHEH